MSCTYYHLFLNINLHISYMTHMAYGAFIKKEM